jgi:hypothetical protein
VNAAEEAETPPERPTVSTATREKRKKGADKREKKERCSCNKADHVTS